MKYILITLACLGGVATPAFCQDVAYTTATAKVKRFAAATCGDARHKMRPQLEVVSTVPELKKYAEAVFADIAATAGLDKPGNSKILVLIGPKSELIKQVPDTIPMNDFLSYLQLGERLRWDKDRVIESPIIVWLHTDIIAKQKLQDPLLASKDYLLRRMLWAFGLNGTSTEFDDSCFSKRNKALRETLSPLDRMLISFAYQHVPPGTRTGQVWNLATVYWNKK